MKIIIASLSLLIVLILGFVYVKISTPEKSFQTQKVEKKEKKVKVLNDFKLETKYDFPARIAYMSVDFRDFRYIEIYKVEIDVNDKFTLFNVKELLKSQNIPFSMIEDKNGIKIYILFRNLAEADRVINLFKEYNFKIKLQKLKQRI
ncbi:hypothetical protein [Caminibacter pacificus]|jgi:hypothetical protein|uniref:Uncharacterized protein n=1 Tax=Caminibacter pacificus TaxID=1424653 RepID=A0AAJ4UYH8_9BACT|nr:hypothetical protein [Caminibacter pacificus]NPA87903.1 hypothetical protein [Campylobacterota bacterium]QCI28409.1 hypothetical protein C6V80_05390 [Caminibacter pacificus]ROR40867.1 hypothetical protein EDC58_0348 [Caminibacter pacificus]